ncbi:hypothetical protein ACQKM2_40255 [Streptomyces sp. NPDC004126]|uniref:hypothetical protein n=1 Tax=Streptomyces sp. NPDC004126 TaxID=3390695 RepID=UPI003D05B1A2
MEVVGPQREGVVADEGPLDQASGCGEVGQAGGGGGQGEVEGVQQADGAQEVAFVGGEVGQGVGEQGREVGAEVRGRGGAAGAAEVEEAQDGEVEVEGQASTRPRWYAVTGPLTPEAPTSQPLHQAGGDAEQAERTVKKVIRWYNARLTEARDGGLDSETIERLWAGRERAVDDLDRLEEADEDTTVQIAVAYAARLKELTGS